MRLAAFSLLLLLIVPFVHADVTIWTGQIEEMGGVALDPNSLLAVWSTYDGDEVRGAIITDGAVGPISIIAQAPSGYFTRDIAADANGDRAAVVILYWPESQDLNRADLLVLEQGTWSRRDVPLDLAHPNIGGVAVAADGTVYVGRAGSGGQELLTYTQEGMTMTELSPWLGAPDVAVDPEGIPHACVSTPVGLVEWTPTETSPILPFAIDLNSYYCAIDIAEDGRAALIAAQPPAIGGSCLDDFCVGTPGSGNLVSATRAASGAWTPVTSAIPFWGPLEVGHDPAGRFFARHEESIRDRIMALSASGLDTRQFVQDPYGSALPVRNFPEPVVIARIDGPPLELRLVPIA